MPELVRMPGQSDGVYPLWRKGDPTRKPQRFSWHDPEIQRRVGMQLATSFIGKTVGDSSSLGPVLSDTAMVETYQMFIKRFPLPELFKKREANGITDTYRRQTGFSQYDPNSPLSVAESGQFVEDRNAYVDDFMNIALFGSIRGASLKSVFGSRAAGGPDVVDDEVTGGLLRVGQDFQSEALRMHNVSSASGSSGAYTPLGVYDPTGFRGLRYTSEIYSPGRNTITVDATSGASSAYDPKNLAIAHAIQDIAQRVMDAGGQADIILGPGIGMTYITREQETKQNFTQPVVEVIPGFTLGGVRTNDGSVLPYYPIPGYNGVGFYSINGVGTYIDIYVADSNGLEIIWLGSEGPVVVEIPIFADLTARALRAVYWFASLEIALPFFLGKVRVKISTLPAATYAANLAA